MNSLRKELDKMVEEGIALQQMEQMETLLLALGSMFLIPTRKVKAFERLKKIDLLGATDVEAEALYKQLTGNKRIRQIVPGDDRMVLNTVGQAWLLKALAERMLEDLEHVEP